MISSAMEDLLRDVYADSRISPEEVIRLRNSADEAAERLLQEEGREGVLDALCKSFDVTNQLLQEALLRAAKGGYTDTGRMLILALLEAHVAHLRVTIDAFQ